MSCISRAAVIFGLVESSVNKILHLAHIKGCVWIANHCKAPHETLKTIAHSAQGVCEDGCVIVLVVAVITVMESSYHSPHPTLA